MAQAASSRDGQKADGAKAGRGVSALRRDDFDRNVWCVLGLPVDIADIDGAVSQIDGAVRDRRRLSFVTPNVNWLVRALRDSQARREIVDADLSLIDGAPLLAFARLLGAPAPSRVAGSDLFEALRRRPSYGGRKIKVFFFGGRDGAAQAADAALRREKGGLEAAGWFNPGHGDVASMSAPEIIDRINEADPDFVVVSLGAAKGQAWIDANKDRLTAPATAHLGAVVDFTAGGVARAPEALRKAGLEWAWRIKEEPALWRRYFGDALFLAGAALTRLAPQALAARRIAPGAAAAAAVVHREAFTQIRLSGDAGHATLTSVRAAFREAAAKGVDVRLDFSALKAFDRAFLGLVLMLEKALARRGRRLYVAGASRAQQRVLRANNMLYAQVGDARRQACETASGEAGGTSGETYGNEQTARRL